MKHYAINDSLNRIMEAVLEDGRKLTCWYDAEGLRHETEENGKLVNVVVKHFCNAYG